MPSYRLKLTAAPSEEPLTLSEVKTALDVQRDDQDGMLSRLLTAARLKVEEDTNRQLCSATWQINLDRWPNGMSGPVYLPKAPIQSIGAVVYINDAGSLTTLASSEYDFVADEPGRLLPAYGKSWPVTRDKPWAIVITYVAGYGAAAAVDARAKQAILLLVGHWYENREAVLTGTISKSIELAYQSLVDSLSYGDEFANYGGREAREIATYGSREGRYEGWAVAP